MNCQTLSRVKPVIPLITICFYTDSRGKKNYNAGQQLKNVLYIGKIPATYSKSARVSHLSLSHQHNEYSTRCVELEGLPGDRL